MALLQRHPRRTMITVELNESLRLCKLLLYDADQDDNAVSIWYSGSGKTYMLTQVSNVPHPGQRHHHWFADAGAELEHPSVR